ncbi:MAG: [Fe-Fe] hydrogenase large subunit C-terminal domain-containing protein [Planctomycetia bacterium]|nr:[Fe-Fe] hydrogenase large subunit C-terminal domain-containing protein [Planctomycetia bacterium]
MSDSNPPELSRYRDNAIFLRREVLIRVARAYLEHRLTESVDRIPLEMRPRNASAIFRCCVYRERAILRLRTLAALGFRVEEDEEERPLREYAERALVRTAPEPPVMTVIDIACHGCPESRYRVTDLCQGCLARHCLVSCRFDAITIEEDGRAVIHPDRCRKCGRCRDACPYSAITLLRVPCEEACPVGSIHRNERGVAEIDFTTCTGCGRCMRRCPFGAIMERSQILDVLRAIHGNPETVDGANRTGGIAGTEVVAKGVPETVNLSENLSDVGGTVAEGVDAADTPGRSVVSSERSDRPVIAIVAPAIVGQFPVPWPKVFGALRKLGFDDVFEVAVGADVTARREAAEFLERMKRGDRFMTTSCCPAYTDTVRRHLPELRPFVSDTGTPMHYAAERVRDRYPEAVVVFIGPCVAKRFEGMRDPLVDHVLTFEELGTLFVASGIEVADCESYQPEPGSSYGRNFAVTGGVAAAVAHAGSLEVTGEISIGKECGRKNAVWGRSDDVEVPSDRPEGIPSLKPICINGLSPAAIRELRLYATRSCPGNLVEVMACEEGCVGGAGTLGNPGKSAVEIRKFISR